MEIDVVLVAARLSRVLVIGAVVALTGSLSALPVAGQDATSPEPADNAPGPTAPGLTVSKVSGEAFGHEAEYSLLEQFVETGVVTSSDKQALVDALHGHDFGTVKSAYKAAGVDSAAATVFTESGEVGPDPEVELPATGGGPIKDSEDVLKVTLSGSDGSRSFPVATDLGVVTEGWPGDTGWARTEAKAEEVVGFNTRTDTIDSECRADLSGVTGSTDIQDGQYLDENFDIKDMPEHPDANDELVDLDQEFHFTINGQPATERLEYSVVVNKQDKDESSITVTGLVEHFKDVAFFDADPSNPVFDQRYEASTAQSHCDIHPDPVVQVVEPKFTG